MRRITVTLSPAGMKAAFVSHRGALHPLAHWLQSVVECVSTPRGRPSGFLRKDEAVRLLTSVAVPCCASLGFCSIIDTHFMTLFRGGVCVLALESLLILNYVLPRDLFFYLQ